MTTEVSPVTETEMRNFAERMVTSFVSLSEQAHQLVEVRAEVDRLRVDMDAQAHRLQNVISENDSLRQQIVTLVAERDNARREAADNLALAQQYERERDEARRRVQEVEQRLNWAVEHNDRLQSEANRLRGEVSEVTSKLTKAEAKLAKLQEHWRAIFEPEAVRADTSPPVQDVHPVQRTGTDDIPF